MDFFLFIAVGFVIGIAFGYLIASLRWKEALGEIKALRSRLDEERKGAAERVSFYQGLLERMREQFKGASLEALRDNNTAFLQLAEASFEKLHEKSKSDLDKKNEMLSSLLTPVKESFVKFETQISEIEKTRLGAYVLLKEQVNVLIESQKSLRDETANLGRALRTPHVRGKWGEMQLKRVVELAGMLAHCDFYEQRHSSEEGDALRPDLVVRLPAGKQIVIDAKVPLISYLEAIEATNEEVRRQKLKEHARVLHEHMAMLAKKSYWERFHPSPEFVILFLPGEPFFSAALEADPSLLEEGVKQKVILATPTTLIALLKAVAYGWQQESLEERAEAICDLARELYKRLSDLGEHFGKVGRSLGSAVDSYNKAVGSLESRVFVTARRFKEWNLPLGEKDLSIIEPVSTAPRPLHVPECETVLHNTQSDD